MQIAIIIAFVIVSIMLVISATAAVFISGHLHGQKVISDKWIVESKRREQRQTRELQMWQTRIVERAGYGSLYKREILSNGDNPPKPSRAIQSPSQVISGMQNREREPRTVIVAPPTPVPPAVRADFINTITR